MSAVRCKVLCALSWKGRHLQREHSNWNATGFMQPQKHGLHRVETLCKHSQSALMDDFGQGPDCGTNLVLLWKFLWKLLSNKFKTLIIVLGSFGQRSRKQEIFAPESGPCFLLKILFILQCIRLFTRRMLFAITDPFPVLKDGWTLHFWHLPTYAYVRRITQ